MSDQDRISPYNVPSKQILGIEKTSISGLLVDPIPNSLN